MFRKPPPPPMTLTEYQAERRKIEHHVESIVNNPNLPDRYRKRLAAYGGKLLREFDKHYFDS